MRSPFNLSVRTDLLAILLLTGVAWIAGGYLAGGNYWDTGYQDWIYNAFRTKSLLLHGLTSWDHIWSQGLSYWRAYQPLPSYITGGLSLLLNEPINRTMVIAGTACFVLMRLFIYIGARSNRFHPVTAFLLACISFTFIGYWNELKDSNIIYAVTVTPLCILLWQRSLESVRARYLFAILTGFSVYLHPLLAICLGGLWLISLLWLNGRFSWWQIGIEFLMMAAAASFYAYGLIFQEPAFVSAYQLQHSFIVIVGQQGSQLSTVYYLLLGVTWLLFLLRNHLFSRNTTILLVFNTLLLAAIHLNMTTTSLDFLNKFQIVRCSFFPAFGLLFVFGEWIDISVQAARKQPLLFTLPIALICYCIVWGMYYASAFGPNPIARMADPVSEFFARTDVPQKGSIYISDSLISSYNMPESRFVIGYNEHLLPNILGVRFRELILLPPAATANPKTLETANDYVKTIGIGYLFLPDDSPYVELFTKQSQTYHILGHQNADGQTYTVLTPPWQPRLAAGLTTDAANQLTACGNSFDLAPKEDGSYAALDACVHQTADVIYGSDAVALSVTYPTPDSLVVQGINNQKFPYTYIAESYSKGWNIPANVSLERTSTSAILANTSSYTASELPLNHTWGNLLIMYGITVIGLIGSLIYLLIRPLPSLTARHHD